MFVILLKRNDPDDRKAKVQPMYSITYPERLSRSYPSKADRSWFAPSFSDEPRIPRCRFGDRRNANTDHDDCASVALCSGLDTIGSCRKDTPHIVLVAIPVEQKFRVDLRVKTHR